MKLLLSAILALLTTLVAVAEDLQAKAGTLMLPAIHFADTSIQEVVSTLNILSKDADPARRGILLVLAEPDATYPLVSASADRISYGAALQLVARMAKLEIVWDANVVLLRPGATAPNGQFGASDRNPMASEIATMEQKQAIFTVHCIDTTDAAPSPGDATGFLARIKGKLFVVTNLHVIRGVQDLKNIQVTDLDGAPVPVGRIYGGKDHDLAIMEYLGTPKSDFAFEFADSASLVRANERILMIGNPLGEGTLLESAGMIRGVGPQKVEYGAATFGGNSGSPVIHLPSGKVVAVHTYVSIRTDAQNPFMADAMKRKASPIQGDARRFGTRFDSIREWEEIRLPEWHRQGRELATLHDKISGFASIVGLAAAPDPFGGAQNGNANATKQSELSRLVEDFRIAQKSNLGATDMDTAIKRFHASVDAYGGRNGQYARAIKEARKSFYSFFREDIDELERFQITAAESWETKKLELDRSLRVKRATTQVQ